MWRDTCPKGAPFQLNVYVTPWTNTCFDEETSWIITSLITSHIYRPLSFIFHFSHKSNTLNSLKSFYIFIASSSSSLFSSFLHTSSFHHIYTLNPHIKWPHMNLTPTLRSQPLPRNPSRNLGILNLKNLENGINILGNLGKIKNSKNSLGVLSNIMMNSLRKRVRRGYSSGKNPLQRDSESRRMIHSYTEMDHWRLFLGNLRMQSPTSIMGCSSTWRKLKS